VPEYGTVEVPVYETRRRPVNLEFTNPFNCCPVSLHLWDKCETVCVGTRPETGVVGWKTESTPVTRTETYVSGTQTKQVEVGRRLETVPAGEREERRCVGWRTETFEIAPAVTQRVRETVDVPAETVTVVEGDDASRAILAPGTTRVLTDAEFRRATAAIEPVASPAPEVRPTSWTRPEAPMPAPPPPPAPLPESAPSMPSPDADSR
jgi:hypothetical protein